MAPNKKFPIFFNMSTIILHDYYESADGGGRLSAMLADELEAHLAYGFAKLPHPFVQGEDINVRERNLSFRSNLPLLRQFRLARSFEYRTHFLQDYTQCIYSGFYTPLAALHQTSGKHILYCHTPPRFVYDQRAFYQQQVIAPLRPLLSGFVNYLQPRYEAAAKRMDLIIANSHNVQKRIKQYLDLDSEVVYPPCDTQRFQWHEQGDFYLSTARLDPLKRVDLIIQAFLQMPDKKLVVASSGSELKKLQKLAQHAPNISFTGYLDDQGFIDLVGRAIATIYLPTDEDFGMSPLESMAAGKPVIGVAEGGLLETIVDGETGFLLTTPPDSDTLIKAVQKLSAPTALSMRTACEARAQEFDSAIFLQKMRELIFT
ncbi:MAG: glycosyltransferase [Pseudomonadota bacterium]